MDTIRVDICYRPIRIAWAIHAGDTDAFRQAVRLSHTLWGGRFNPIVVVQHEEEAARLIDLFRVDMIHPVGDSEYVKEFPKRFQHLINPLYPNQLYIGGVDNRKKAQLLDLHNALVHMHDSPEWTAIKEKGVRIYTWLTDDPLTDIFLVQLGMYVSADENVPPLSGERCPPEAGEVVDEAQISSDESWVAGWSDVMSVCS